MNHTWVCSGIWVAGLVGCVLLVAKAQDPQSAATEFKPAAPTHALMLDQEHHFNGIRDLINNDKAKDRFETMEQQAYVLAELGNVNYYQSKAKDYQEWAASMRNDSKALADAAKKKDVEGARTLLSKINDTCNACHEKHRDDDE